jgi:hypothetical protein
LKKEPTKIQIQRKTASTERFASYKSSTKYAKFQYLVSKQKGSHNSREVVKRITDTFALYYA